MSAQRAEVLRIAASMTAACAIGAALLGAVYVATDRYQEAARAREERQAVSRILGLGPAAAVLEVRQILIPARREVIYRESGTGADSELVFTYDGALARHDAAASVEERGAVPAGRLFLAREKDRLRGFVVEGEARGYKNRIRFFVGLDRTFRISGVDVVEHEEDPGLGAEVATTWFEGQYAGRESAALGDLTVTRDPMPEDWRAALLDRRRVEPRTWSARYRALADRESRKPIYAVTGATISSRALTDGVRNTVAHFQRRWELLAPYFGAESNEPTAGR